MSHDWTTRNNNTTTEDVKRKSFTSVVMESKGKLLWTTFWIFYYYYFFFQENILKAFLHVFLQKCFHKIHAFLRHYKITFLSFIQYLIRIFGLLGNEKVATAICFCKNRKHLRFPLYILHTFVAEGYLALYERNVRATVMYSNYWKL